MAGSPSPTPVTCNKVLTGRQRRREILAASEPIGFDETIKVPAASQQRRPDVQVRSFRSKE